MFPLSVHKRAGFESFERTFDSVGELLNLFIGCFRSFQVQRHRHLTVLSMSSVSPSSSVRADTRSEFFRLTTEDQEIFRTSNACI